MRRSFDRRLAWGSTAAAALMLLAAPAAVHAQQRATYSFDIPAQDLSSALRAFGQASGQQLAVAEATVHGTRAPALSGA